MRAKKPTTKYSASSPLPKWLQKHQPVHRPDVFILDPTDAILVGIHFQRIRCWEKGNCVPPAKEPQRLRELLPADCGVILR